MAPTQAQIEAAAKAYKAAYMSAATHFEAIALALTAAAEVGADPELDDITIRLQLERIKLLEDELSTTIECCAQVADNFLRDGEDVPYGIQNKIAAAIRALKDKP